MKLRVLVGAWLAGGTVLAAACAHPTNGEESLQGNGIGSGGAVSAGGTSSTSSTSSNAVTSNAVTTSGGVSGPSTSDVGGSAGASATTGTGGGSGAGSSLGGAAGAPNTTEGTGGTVPEDECTVAADCEQPAGECVVCEPAATTARECVNLGPSVCDGETRDACELCDGTDLGELPTSCVDFGGPGEFSGGTVVCNDTCDDYDTSGCSVCGNDVTDPAEACDGDDVPLANCASLGLPPPSAGGDDVDLPCLDSCEFDASGCALCSVAEADCLLGPNSDCTGADCAGKQCAAGEICAMTCGNGDRCPDLSCNMSAECMATCDDFGVCDETCEPLSECELDCSAGFGSNCELVCAAEATCTLSCAQKEEGGEERGACDIQCDVGSNCNVVAGAFKSDPTGSAYCAAGGTCDYVCLNQTDCSGLLVTCAPGAHCNVECIDFGTTCPTVTCLEGSSCSFDCPNNQCNAPICAEGAECDCVGESCDFQAP